MSALSQELLELLQENGFRKGTGVNNDAIRLVKSLAKQAGTPDWPHTRTPADYHKLLWLVYDHVEATR